MIRFAPLFHIAGYFLLILAASMTVPIAVSLIYADSGLSPLLWSMVVTAAPGALFYLLFQKPKQDLNVREAIFLVVLLWMAVCVFGAIPFYLSPEFPSPVDALFESTAGFTTSGSSILRDVEVLPASIQFWRCFSHWLGGIGIVLLGVAILPMLGGTGYQLFRAQSGMLKSEKIRPRVIETVRALWFVYVSMSALEFVLLMAGGMTWFDAACHTFATVATGGFSPRSASVGAYDSPFIQYTIAFFMMAASINFALHFQFGRTRNPMVFFRSTECRFHVVWLLAASLFCTVQLLQAGTYGLEEAWRKSLFMVVSIGTTTGFANDDYNLWPASTQVLMIILMFFGGNAGSTSGGLKTFRVQIALKTMVRHMYRMVERRAVFGIRLGRDPVDEETVSSAMQVVPLVFLFYAVMAVALGLAGCDLVTSLSGPAATMFGVGPGLGTIGPAGNFATVSDASKLIFCFAMLAGRLEFYTLLVLCTPGFWRR